jgi:hypothetical protein
MTLCFAFRHAKPNTRCFGIRLSMTDVCSSKRCHPELRSEATPAKDLVFDFAFRSKLDINLNPNPNDSLGNRGPRDPDTLSSSLTVF